MESSVLIHSLTYSDNPLCFFRIVSMYAVHGPRVVSLVGEVLSGLSLPDVKVCSKYCISSFVVGMNGKAMNT